MSYYYHYNEHPMYRCSTCGRRCGPNGHAGCGNAELINGFPALVIPFMVGFLWLGVSLLAALFCLLCGTELWSGWWVMGGILIGGVTVLTLLTVIMSAADETKHKQYKGDIDKTIYEGMKAGKTADVIHKELEEYGK